MASNRRQLAIILIFTSGVLLAQVIPFKLLIVAILSTVLYWYANSDVKSYERKLERSLK